MRIVKYKTLQENGIPYLVKEKGTNYGTYELCDNPEKIVHMLNEVFELDRETEEHMYLIALATSCKVLGVFEISHGTINSAECSPREVFMKALLCGAVSFILAHNHPGGNIKPSMEDINLTRRVHEAAKIMNLPLTDHIIVGEYGQHFSFKKNGVVIADKED